MRQVLVTIVALVSIFANAGATETNIRTYVLYGQGGPLMSRGMEALAASLEKMDKRLHVSVHEWKNHKEIAKEIAKLPHASGLHTEAGRQEPAISSRFR